MTDYGYMLEKVLAFTRDLELAARENSQPILQQVWYCISTDECVFDDISEHTITHNFLRRFNKLTLWEKTNVMYEIAKQIEAATKVAANRFAKEAREADRGKTMLDVRCQEALDEAKKFAESLGALENLEEQITQLERIGTNMNATSIVITKDFTEYGFGWSIMRNEKCVYNGGLLFCPPGDWGGGPPNFSVNLDPSSKPEWRIHS